MLTPIAPRPRPLHVLNPVVRRRRLSWPAALQPVLVSVLAVLFAAGCAAPAPVPPSATTASSGGESASQATVPGPSTVPAPVPTGITAPWLQGRLTCGAPDLEFPADVMTRPAAEGGLDSGAAALRAFVAADTPDGGLLPRTGWRRVIEEPERVVYLAPVEAGWTMASFTRSGDGPWQDWESGACALSVVLPDGVGFAAWRLDPAAPPQAGATTVRVLATEIACAGGKPPVGRVLPAKVVESDQAITIAIEVRSRPGGQDCPGNPEVPIDVTLAAPLGTRHVFDGSTVPPTERVPG
jgi:hypothetical protein